MGPASPPLRPRDRGPGPETLLFHAPGRKLSGSIDLPTNYDEEHAGVQTMTVQGRDLTITCRTYNGARSEFRYWSGRVHWDGNAMQLLDVRQTG
jgi:hypothetical protein